MGILAILALIYWVFAFVFIEVFGLRIFRANISEFFIFSVLGILALMASALMLNVMLNLTRLADNTENTTTSVNLLPKKFKMLFVGLMALFPLLAGGLFLGDYANTQKKKSLMQTLAEQIIQSQANRQVLEILNQPNQQEFYKATLSKLANHFASLDKKGLAIQSVAVIMPADDMGDYLMFDNDNTYARSLAYSEKEDTTVAKTYFTQHFTPDKQDYLTQVFAGQITEPLFDHHQGYFELFYPYRVDGKTVAVYYFKDYMSYGKY